MSRLRCTLSRLAVCLFFAAAAYGQTVTISATDVSVSEGAGSVDFHVLRSGDTSGSTTATLVAVNGNAHNGDDYDFFPSTYETTVTFAPGETDKTLNVPILEDAQYEANEWFWITISNVSGGSAGQPVTLKVTIVDDDPPTGIGFSAAAYSASEGAGSVTLTLQRTGSTAGTSQVRWYPSPYSGASNGADFSAPVDGGTIVFGPGEAAKTLNITILQDSVFEGPEQFQILLELPVNASLDNNTTTVTINDDDPGPVVSFAQTTATVHEYQSPVTVALQRSGDTAGSTAVNWAVTSGSASTGLDFGDQTSTVTFGPGETSKNISVSIIDDNFPESTETFRILITVVAPVGTQVDGTKSDVTVSILDDESTGSYGFAQPDYSIAENGGSVSLTVVRTGATDGPGIINYQTIPGPCCGTAQAFSPDDFGNPTGQLSFAPGETAKTISIPIVNDTFHEPTEAFTVVLYGASGGQLGSASSSKVTILDDDPAPVIRFAASTFIVDEGQPAALEVIRSGNTAGTTTVDYSMISDTAIAALDFDTAETPIVFAPGETHKTILINTVDDALAEGTEMFRVRLLPGPGAAGVGVVFEGFNPVTVFIRDNEKSPELSVDDPVVLEGDAGTTKAIFTITLSGPFASPVLVFYQTSDVTAKAGVDYGGISGFVTFQPGETAKTVSVAVQGDLADEGDELFHLNIVNSLSCSCSSSATAACCSQPKVIKAFGTGTIRNDDASFSVADTGANEGDSGTNHAVFTVRLTAPLNTTATVDYRTAPGSAQPGSDYQSVSGTLVFAPGETSKKVSVPVLGDTVPEGNEVFGLRLENPVGAPIARGNAKCTILDNDAFFTLNSDLEYAVAGGRSLALDLYVPTSGGGPFPLIIWIHGDHWSDGSKTPSDAVRETQRGYALASIDYRSSDVAPFPAQIHDLKAALRWLHANAARFNLDPDRFAAWGTGAGGHLAALLGTSAGIPSLEDTAQGNAAESAAVQAVVDVAGPIDLLQWKPCGSDEVNPAVPHFLGCQIELCAEQAAAASPTTYITSDDPPFLIVHGAEDCVVQPSQSVAFRDALRSGHVSATLMVIEEAGHQGPGLDPADAQIDAFLDAILKSPAKRRSMGR
jgi:acetyl esterase/lipase